MLTSEEATDLKAIRASGWAISRIARHLNRDRKTIRSYLTGQRVPGVRRAGPDALESFTDYCQRRLTDEPRLPAAALFKELAELGYRGAYSTFTRTLRNRGLRPKPVLKGLTARPGLPSWSAEPRTGGRPTGGMALEHESRRDKPTADRLEALKTLGTQW